MLVKPLSLKPLVTSLPSLMVLCISVERRFFCFFQRWSRETKARDTKKFRGQVHRRKCCPKKKRSSKSDEKGLKKYFSGDPYLRKPKKGLCRFRKRSRDKAASQGRHNNLVLPLLAFGAYFQPSDTQT